MSDDERLPDPKEGMLRTFKMIEGDLLVGIAQEELPNHVILHIVKANLALAIPLEMAYDIHDALCESIAMLGGDNPDIATTLPTDKSKWN